MTYEKALSEFMEVIEEIEEAEKDINNFITLEELEVKLEMECAIPNAKSISY